MYQLFLVPLVGVATVLTVYGIETKADKEIKKDNKLQQYLPFTVLKPVCSLFTDALSSYNVATVLTVYGIETGKYQDL